MSLKYALTAILVLGFAGCALAANQFYIVQDKDKNCRVVEEKPVSDETMVVQIGKQAYQTREEAEADIKVVCVKPD